MDRLTNQMPKLALILLLVASATADAAIVLGTPSCGYWIQDRQPGGRPSYFNSMWLVGYLSGAAVHSGKDILRGTDNESIEVRMDNYCKANSLKNIAHGAEALFDELVPYALTDQPSPAATALAPVTPAPPAPVPSAPAIASPASAKALIDTPVESSSQRVESPAPAPIAPTYSPKALTLTNTLPLGNSKYQFTAERYARANGCIGPAATMNIKTATSETFTLSCSNGAALSIRCDPNCRDLQ
jgi:hypothetical protein